MPADRRYDLLRDVDLLVAPHRPSLETRLALRTRFLDALAAGTPVVATEGGAVARLLAEHHAGWVVPPEDPAALAAALEEALATGDAVGRVPAAGEPEGAAGRPAGAAGGTGEPGSAADRRSGAHELVALFAWERVLAPLVRFCRDPRPDPTKERFAFRPPTVAPADRAAFRLRRWWRRYRRYRRQRRHGRRRVGQSGEAER